jgi:hypothetical protein
VKSARRTTAFGALQPFDVRLVDLPAGCALKIASDEQTHPALAVRAPCRSGLLGSY